MRDWIDFKSKFISTIPKLKYREFVGSPSYSMHFDEGKYCELFVYQYNSPIVVDWVHLQWIAAELIRNAYTINNDNELRLPMFFSLTAKIVRIQYSGNCLRLKPATSVTKTHQWLWETNGMITAKRTLYYFLLAIQKYGGSISLLDSLHSCGLSLDHHKYRKWQRERRDRSKFEANCDQLIRDELDPLLRGGRNHVKNGFLSPHFLLPYGTIPAKIRLAGYVFAPKGNMDLAITRGLPYFKETITSYAYFTDKIKDLVKSDSIGRMAEKQYEKLVVMYKGKTLKRAEIGDALKASLKKDTYPFISGIPMVLTTLFDSHDVAKKTCGDCIDSFWNKKKMVREIKNIKESAVTEKLVNKVLPDFQFWFKGYNMDSIKLKRFFLQALLTLYYSFGKRFIPSTIEDGFTFGNVFLSCYSICANIAINP